LKGASLDYLLHPVPLGIAAGLFLGKQVGILAFAWVGVKLGLASLPQGINWRNLYGAATLCGVGFTMSLFIGSLAFEGADTAMLFDERLGIIVGSLVSGAMGYAVLRMVLPQRPANP
ncbi:MAG: Na+/H+ antiporter NhaA, partial [Planctomycetota bacterium]|jgi:NhaA family Na+:H+ antiporter